VCARSRAVTNEGTTGHNGFPLAEQGQKTKGIPDGALVTIELNEAGTVIDLHRADIGLEMH
jgi:hypothetical protein